MKLKFKNSIFVLVTLCLISCASGYKDFNVAQIPSHESAFNGRVTVRVNGQDKTDSCYLRVQDSKEEGKAIKLDYTGHVAHSAAPGKVEAKVLSCNLGMEAMIVEFKDNELFFNNGRSGTLTNFGHVTFDVTRNGSSAGLMLLGPIGGAIAGATESSRNTYKINVKNGLHTKEIGRTISSINTLKRKNSLFVYTEQK